MHNINYGVMWYDNYYRQFYTKLNKNGPKHGQVTFCNNSHLGGTRQKLPVGICLATIAQYKFPIDIDNDTRGNNDLYVRFCGLLILS